MARTYDPPPAFIPRAQRIGRISPYRDVPCRSCALPTVHVDGRWVHRDDGTPACVYPAILRPLQETPDA